ncbi:MAG TPA: hypothetical protein VFY71_09465 [Planctomycetota bacterium]|nr:hypothetical protein [Planctomycetota bacterium]
MLTSLLLAALLPLQDAPAQTPPAAAPPAEAPAAAAVPAETPDSVRKFLQDAEAHLYDPQAAGLSSLEFDVPIAMPDPIGTIGTAHVTWAAGGEANVDVTRPADMTLPMGLQPAQVDGQGRQMAMQLLGSMLNKPITPILEGAVAMMDGVEDGLVKVAIRNAAAEAQGVESMSLYFDDAGLLQRVKTVANLESAMGKVKVQQSQAFAWKPAIEGSDLVVADVQKTIADMGMMKISTETSFGYTTVSGIILATTASTTSEVPMKGKMTQTIAATNLKVNGQAVGG